MRTRLLPLLAAALLMLQLVDPASAAWSTGAVGSGGAVSGTLAAPAGVTLAWDPVVHVSWSASSSTWASGYRVLRSVSATGPWTQIADVGAAVRTVDDSPGAGTHYYAVRAYRNGWSSSLGGVAARADPTYVFAGGTVGGAGCAAAPAGTFAMRQGYRATGTALSRTRNDGTFGFCTDSFSAGQTLPAGTSTLTAGIVKSNGSTCHITALLLLNGTTLLGNGVLPVEQGGLRMESVSFATSAHTFADGDRLELLLQWEGVKACSGTDLHWNGATTPSALTLPA